MLNALAPEVVGSMLLIANENSPLCGTLSLMTSLFGHMAKLRNLPRGALDSESDMRSPEEVSRISLFISLKPGIRAREGLAQDYAHHHPVWPLRFSPIFR